MPVQDMKEPELQYDYCVILNDKASGLDVEVFLTLDWPGEAYWSGGRYEPWSLEVTTDPTFEVNCAVLCDGEDTVYNLSQKQTAKAIDIATKLYWEAYVDDSND